MNEYQKGMIEGIASAIVVAFVSSCFLFKIIVNPFEVFISCFLSVVLCYMFCEIGIFKRKISNWELNNIIDQIERDMKNEQ